jgi:hypothetical protein
MPGSSCGKERVKESFFRVRLNASAGVSDFENDDVGFAVGNALAIGARAQGDSACAGDAVGGVLNEVDNHLLESGRSRR